MDLRNPCFCFTARRQYVPSAPRQASGFWLECASRAAPATMCSASVLASGFRRRPAARSRSTTGRDARPTRRRRRPRYYVKDRRGMQFSSQLLARYKSGTSAKLGTGSGIPFVFSWYSLGVLLVFCSYESLRVPGASGWLRQADPCGSQRWSSHTPGQAVLDVQDSLCKFPGCGVYSLNIGEC